MTSNAKILNVMEAGGIRAYAAAIRSFPYLSAEEEDRLARAAVENDDRDAEARLVNSHLRLVLKIAFKFARYGGSVEDLLNEGTIGLITGIRRFEPDKGFRISTYATWWIRAAIQESVLRNHSLVRMGTSAGQKKLFFHLRKLKAELGVGVDTQMTPSVVSTIAGRLGVTEVDVLSMNGRLGGETSLSAPIRSDEGSLTLQDMLVDAGETPDAILEREDEMAYRRQLLIDAMSVLNERERRIFTARRLEEDVLTLDALAIEYSVSRERIRQIEVRALQKVTKLIHEDIEDDEFEGVAAPALGR